MKKHIFWGKLPKYNLQQPKEVTMDCFLSSIIVGVADLRKLLVRTKQ